MKDRIKTLRKTLGLTQQEFADRLRIKRGAIANYEIGRNEPVDSVVALICREFSVNEEWLRTGNGPMIIQTTRPQEIAEFMAEVTAEAPEGIRYAIVSTLAKLETKDWDAIAQLLKSFQHISHEQKHPADESKKG